MRLFIALPVLIVVVAMALEGPAPAQAAPDFSSAMESLPDKLKEFGNTLEDKARAAIEHIKQKEIMIKTRLGPFRELVFRDAQQNEGEIKNHICLSAWRATSQQQRGPRDGPGPSSNTNKNL
uniref:Apolipoprotein C1 n=1 Tax=Rattus norvegicus TaxID=10116 RepID=A0A8L2ULG0_RAT